MGESSKAHSSSKDCLCPPDVTELRRTFLGRARREALACLNPTDFRTL
jgi:hypothetical protein